MFVSAAFLVAALNIGASLGSVVKRAEPTVDDTTVLQYALTLEHLENNFYTGALAKFDAKAFADAGFPSWVRGRFAQIGGHEKSHVAFLQKAIGAEATQACEYSFPYTDPKSFAALSMVLEGVGTSAYLGAAKYISNKDYLTAAASILVVESRHDAWVSATVDKGSAWNEAYDTPLGLSGVYSLASQFITSCPSMNPALPVTPLAKLALYPAAPTPGSKVTVGVDGKSTDGTYLAYYSGLQVLYSKIEGNTTTVPASLANAGTVYVAATTASSGVPTDAQLNSGLGIFDFGFSATATQ